jgi:DNA adenine methylase
MLTQLHKTPFPWFGGKADAAVAVWEALGDVAHYVEPFAGSLAVLLRRPHPCNRTYYSETVNDLDGYLVNVWRAIQQHPDETAEFCSWPVTEADLMARHLWLLKWKDEAMIERLMADPDFCDPKAAGCWLYGCCAWIGGGWCDGKGAWIVNEDGRIVKREKGEPGVSRQLPHISNNGRGVHRPQSHEPGVDDGSMEFHPMTMPELRRWFAFLSARLRHVRIVNGDWGRVCTSGAAKMLEVRQGHGQCGFFIDPPYGHSANRAALYTEESFEVADAVRDWCMKNGDDPDYRIVLAGFDGEHNELESHGWRVVEWFKAGFLKGGMSNGSQRGHQQGRERLWLSPHCLGKVKAPQSNLFEVAS